MEELLSLCAVVAIFELIACGNESVEKEQPQEQVQEI